MRPSAPLLLLALATAASAAQPVAWVEDSLVRVGRGDPVRSAPDASISAARGESESFQIVVRAVGGALGRVDLRLSDLSGPGGAVIPASRYTRYREHYVAISPSSADWGGGNRPLGAGQYPDALIPFTDDAGRDLVGAALDAAPFAVADGSNQPLWIDLDVPRDAAPGRYAGTWRITSAQGEAAGRVDVLVRGFALPRRPALRTSFAFWRAPGRADLVELLRHRLSPLSVPLDAERSLIDGHGLTGANLGFWSGADQGTMSMSPPPGAATVRARAATHQSDLPLYNFTADEITGATALYEPLKAWARDLHAAGIDNLVTIPPVDALLDDGSGSGRSAVDIWVMLPLQFAPAAAVTARARAKGDEIWSYNCLAQDGFSPKWLIDHRPLEFRLQPGFLNLVHGCTGLLYWRVDRWNDADPWNQVNNAGDFSSANFPGDGHLVYPGAQVGLPHVVPSMRLKWLRDGVDDYDYLALLSRDGRADAALAIARTIAPDWSGWTRDPAAARAARDRLAVDLEADRIPPAITARRVEPLTSRSATVRWTTDEPADGAAIVATDGAADRTVVSTASTRDHAIVIDGLRPGTTYRWSARSRDQAGNVTASGALVFATPAEPPDGGGAAGGAGGAASGGGTSGRSGGCGAGSALTLAAVGALAAFALTRRAGAGVAPACQTRTDPRPARDWS
ncbi:MAG TPA: glycoside hydrolase domain-containing protein [Planctomycetota bacterium]|nr:glycoside hydrolase domain-containing protein [Planctomycetota bacterium]